LLAALVVASARVTGVRLRRVVRSRAGLLLPGVGVDGGKVARGANTIVLGNACGLQFYSISIAHIP